MHMQRYVKTKLVNKHSGMIKMDILKLKLPCTDATLNLVNINIDSDIVEKEYFY